MSNEYSGRITDQIFEADNAFFLESGVQMEKAVELDIPGAYGGIRYPVENHDSITQLEIILEASDLYTVKVTKAKSVVIQNVFHIKTQQPIVLSEGVDEIRVERVFAFDLIKVLWAIFYGNRTPNAEGD